MRQTERSLGRMKFKHEICISISQHDIMQRKGAIMKLILAIIQAADEADSVQELNKRGFFVTKLSTTGGFLKAKNTTLLIGTDDEKVDTVLEVLKKYAGHRMQLSPVSGADMRMFNPAGANMVEVPAGGCVVFVLDIDKAQKF